MKMFNTRGSRIAAMILVLVLACVLVVAESKEKKQQGYLGVAIEKLDKEGKSEHGVTHGVLVIEVTEDSPAEKAGLQKNDVILYFNDEKIRTADDLVDAVRETEPETVALVKIMRDGKEKSIKVTVGKLKSSRLFTLGTGNGNLHIYKIGEGGYLGVQLREMNPDLASYFSVKAGEGMLVLEVAEDSPAEAAGIKSGDVLMAVDGETITDMSDVYDILAGFEAGETVEVMVVRKNRKLNLKVEIAENDHDVIHIFEDGPAGIFERHRGTIGRIPRFNYRKYRKEDDKIWKEFREDLHQELEGLLKEGDRDLERIHEEIEKKLPLEKHIIIKT